MPICMKLPICWNNIQEQWNDQKQQAIYFRIFYIFLFRNIWKCNHKNHQTLHWWDRSNNQAFLLEEYSGTMKRSKTAGDIFQNISKYFIYFYFEIFWKCYHQNHQTLHWWDRSNNFFTIILGYNYTFDSLSDSCKGSMGRWVGPEEGPQPPFQLSTSGLRSAGTIRGEVLLMKTTWVCRSPETHTLQCASNIKAGVPWYMRGRQAVTLAMLPL